jgi:hypothetical protein
MRARQKLAPPSMPMNSCLDTYWIVEIAAQTVEEEQTKNGHSKSLAR